MYFKFFRVISPSPPRSSLFPVIQKSNCDGRWGYTFWAFYQSFLWFFANIRFRGGFRGTILRYPILVMDPKNFLKASLAPTYIILMGRARRKKRNFSVKIFQKVPKNAFFGLFFQNFACSAKSLAKIGTKQCFGRARKINLVYLKKFFENHPPPPPPLEKILDPPLIRFKKV